MTDLRHEKAPGAVTPEAQEKTSHQPKGEVSMSTILSDFVPSAERVEQQRCSASVEVVTNRNSPGYETKVRVTSALQCAGFRTQHLPHQAWSDATYRDDEPRILVSLHGDHQSDVAEGATIQVVTPHWLPEEFANLDFTRRTWKVHYAITWDFQEGELPWKTITDYCKQLANKFFDSVEVNP